MPNPIVLIADDDAAIRGLLRVILRKENYDVDEARNGQEAIRKLDATCYDAVVLDLMMGPGNGFEVLDSLKTRWPGEKIVVVVSAASEKTIQAVAGENVWAILRKPFDVTDLLRLVRECVER